MTREERLDAMVREVIPLLERLRESVINHPIVSQIDGVLSRARAIELPQEPSDKTGTIKKILGDRRDEIRDPGEHEQHLAEQWGLADK